MNNHTPYNAGRLAQMIETYWHERGAGHVRAERYPLGDDFPGMWGVRSNLVGGKPPKTTLRRVIRERVAA